MIDKEYGSYTLACDICGREVKPFDGFKDAVQYKKDNGWKSFKYRTENEDIWQDSCPDCQD